MQKLELEIRHIIIVTGRGTDKISFSVPNNEALDKTLGDTEARENFPELNFDLQITRGKGEDLLSALGLVADEVIPIQNEYNFNNKRSGEETNARS